MQQAGVPAWKRIGLKLKYAKESPELTATSNSNQDDILARPGELQSSSAEPPKKKRRVGPETNGHPTDTVGNTNTSRTDQAIEEARRPKKPKKRVSFSADTKPISSSPAASSPEEDSKLNEHLANKKKPKSKSKQMLQHVPAQRLNASLDYLNQYHTNRTIWKFNKNRETWILKHAFTEDDIPREYDIALAKYIHGLQGSGARDRLRAQCLDILRKEEEARREVNASHEDRGQLHDEEFSQRFRKDLEFSSGPGGGEGGEEYVAWIRQKSRAQLLLWSLGFDDRSVVTNGIQPSDPKGGLGDGYTNGDGKQTHREKKRKNRTAVVDYDSSSSSSSDSDTDSEDSDGEVRQQRQAEEETSSSGSSDDDTDSDSTDVDSAD
ncbi:hypothetical protein A1O3_02785 [Capronia epimyces CBS 606.96]|uniref:WKF domain-containing protein n=1 Tax=Capronia epimyces CBS 606.96 TaxID=1182542 RepID=W9YB13_9EURO|nr:uncharacterized protein A1O3_02785 [Capronia epimyces CBS 606.96]EXJ89718.1 hypothetical protein A1O3_02785 [Capronia epimyces CBS 606.96]